ncbi:alpha/beta-hydrolase [Wolfiporia cocos MD-104 SS10]|uniref:Alpha/beta-hydrolase n=1 Tax=Wolfiporia cocos (strain MD-104) TaxID=742152 RepID=A0A2H3JNN4_WOLCO|nr:alpha/beta-hydrolase [Wolfiporia cocos MD-104 SS10]
MIDHLLGRPSPSWKRVQVFLVIIFWVWRILRGNPGGPRLLWLRRANRALQRFTPWQLIVSTLTGVYAVRHLDKILGLGAPEPLADLYSPSYYRATWINTGLEAGFATAMSIRPKWLKDLCSVLFSVYYIVYANEAEEKIRKYRAVPTVEILRTTWEKTTNPYLRAFTHLPKVTIRRKLYLPRPNDSLCSRPITAWLFFAPPEHHLARATELILDFPGGGFISMTPEHHEERLRMWAVRTGKPVLSIDYGKAPEYPYPYAIDECFDVYRSLVDSAGQIVGMSGHKFSVVLTGDSAGAHIATCVMMRILETQLPVPHPQAMVLAYACLDFNFTSWMTPANLRVLQSEQSSGNIPGLAAQKDHLSHVSPLSMVGNRKAPRRRSSWRDALRTITSPTDERPALRPRHSAPAVKSAVMSKTDAHMRPSLSAAGADDAGDMADTEDGVDASDAQDEEEKPLEARVRFHLDREQHDRDQQHEASTETIIPDGDTKASAPIGTRLTMTSRAGYFADRVVSPSFMRAMAILYIGPYRNPDFGTDYYLSPILAPPELLAQFPAILMNCGEKDPFVDDTVIFAGRVREAKRARKRELEAALARRGAARVEPFGARARASSAEALRALRREHEQLAGEGDEDWVTMQIFSEWSHGYLQMPTLMAEARTVINDLADWIDAAFARGGGAKRGPSATAGAPAPKRVSPARRGAPPAADASSASAASETELETETDDVLTFSPRKRASPPLSTDVSGNKQRTPSPPRQADGQAAHSGGGHERAQGASARKSDEADGALDASEAADPRFDLLHAVLPQPTPQPAAREQKAGRRDASPGFSTRAGTPGGQTISESELMRRRRLLDSRLISSENAR